MITLLNALVGFFWSKNKNVWNVFFENVFRKVKDIFNRSYPITDEEASSQLVALRIAIFSLPCAIKVLEVRVDTDKHKQIKDEICHLIGYDFSVLGKVSVEYLGIIEASEKEKLVNILFKEYGFERKVAEDFAESFSHELRTIGVFDPSKPDLYLQFTLYNILKNVDEYATELFMILMLEFTPFVGRFRKDEIDWNSEYDLKSDQILPMSEIIRKDPIMDAFVGLRTIEDVQKAISDIQLIPAVPEQVKRVFTRAKELFIFGYFRYSFFTISNHYVFLALESAIKHRYIQSLGEKAILTDKKRKDLRFEITSPSYQLVWDFCRNNKRQGWSARGLNVNDEPFPWNSSLLLDWLVEKRILRKWEKEMFREGIYLRDSLSHLEQASIFAPNSGTLERVADDINKLFYRENSLLDTCLYTLLSLARYI